MIKRYFQQFAHSRTLAKLHDIDQRKRLLAAEIDCARREMMRLDGKEAIERYKLRMM